MSYDIFISYRRNGGFETAKHISDLLVRDGYTVSFDLDTLREGSFDSQLLSRIDECTDFIIIIDRHAFDRTLDPTFNPEMDWMRRELAHALRQNKVIIPILLSGAHFPDSLPEDIRNVIYKNGPEYSQGYFDAFYQKLKSFLHSKPSERRNISSHNMAAVTFYSDKPCYIEEAGRILGEARKEGSTIELQKGVHRLVYVRIDDPSHSYQEEVQVKEAGVSQTVDVSFLLHPRPLDFQGIKRASEMLETAMNLEKCADNEKVFFSRCRDAAEIGYAEGILMLAQCYLDGRGVDKNVSEGKRLLKGIGTLADHGDIVAQYCRGLCYETGIDIETGDSCEPNKVEAVKWYRRSAERGFFKAQDELGSCYKFGFGVEKDVDVAVKWYRRSAEQGYADAQASLGLCYLHGDGLVEDKEEAVKWLRRAAEQNHSWAQCLLGQCFYEGNGVDNDDFEAVKWFTRAAERGDDDAQYYLGECYYGGRGVPKDSREALKWYRRAAEQDQDDAQCKLGDFYLFGEVVDENVSEAIKWYRRAAEHEYGEAVIHAQDMLGSCYYYGKGVHENVSEAIKWYRRAAEHGYSDDGAHAQYMLGQCYYYGKGVAQDYSQAFKYFEDSAYAGNLKARWALARCYANGIGVEKDLSMAEIVFEGIPPESREGFMTKKELLGEGPRLGGIIGRLVGKTLDVLSDWI